MHALRLLSMEDKTVTDEMMQSKANEIRAKHPLLANILDRIRQMNLKETYTGMLVLDRLEHILKARQVEGPQREGFVVVELFIPREDRIEYLNRTKVKSQRPSISVYSNNFIRMSCPFYIDVIFWNL